VLTDGDIYDAEKKETKDQFHKIANKASFCLIGYTHRPVHAPGFKSVFIKL
jgi:hypothetical protein